MFRKNYFTFFLAVALFLTGNIAVSAQIVPIRGRVELQKADGTKVPVADATVDALRPGASAKFLSSKTSKKGEFGFAGFPLGTILTLSVSAPNISPQIAPGVNSGDEGVLIIVREGDGKRLTEEEVRQGANAATTNTQKGELTAEQKKEQEEYEKRVAEVNTKNVKSKETDELVGKAFDEGKKAFNDKNYDMAIAKFDEGYKASPNFVGSAPVLLNNKAMALRLRGTILYNESAKLTDATARLQNMNKVMKDFADAVDAYNLSWTVSKNAPATDITDQKSYDASKMQSLRGLKDLVKVLVVTEKIDNSKTDVIKTLMQEYIAIESDKAAKAEAQVALADVYRIAGDPDNAIVEYRKALEISPDNPDALAGLGLSLFDAGVRSDNTEQKQEGLNYMQRFADIAPSTHKLKESVAGAVEYLKSEKLTPQKTTKKKN